MKENIVEKEIDLRELFKTIWDKRVFILVFTLVITILSIIYVNMKTPIYQVKSVVKIGHINDVLLENNNVLVQKLKLIYNVGNKNYGLSKENKAIVSNVGIIFNLNNFIEIHTQAFSNKEALELNKEVIKYIQKEYKFKLDSFILKTNTNIKNLNISIKDITVFEEEKVKRDIEKIKKQTLLKIENQIKFKKEVELKTIEDKLKFLDKKLKDYEKNITLLTKASKSNTTNDILKSIQLSNIQNLVLRLQNDISELDKEKNKILNIVLKDLELKKHDILVNKIKVLENKLIVTIPSKIGSLKDKIIFEKNKLKNIENSVVVGNYLIQDAPISPKKNLIIMIAFIVSLISSFLIVLLSRVTK